MKVALASDALGQWRAQREANEAMRAAANRTHRAWELGETGLAERLLAARRAREMTYQELDARAEALDAQLRVRIDSHDLWHLGAAEDKHEYVRAEAILGLARRDKALALPLLQRELRGEQVAMPLFEAAALVADPSLADDLRQFASPSGDSFLDELATKALAACEAVD